MSGDDKFLNRWSRRKTEAKEKPVQPEAPARDAEAKGAVAARTEDRPNDGDTEKRKPDAIDLDALPDIDSMDENSDFSVFMQDGIPDALRNRALRKLWQTDPAFNVVDGLVEYGEDFTDLTAVAESVKTAYKVGKGMVEDEETADAKDAETDAEPAVEAATTPREIDPADDSGAPEESDRDAASPKESPETQKRT
ncbi:MAG: DUF3306 domain-containing protein [Alphaproteobacteria bacterium]|nr:DUF3306 domain-containing protein [Alphaproteobacteria bacterium]